MEKILRALWVVYLCVGVGLFIKSPGLDDATVLMMTTTGKRCTEAPALIMAWPLYLEKGGRLRRC